MNVDHVPHHSSHGVNGRVIQKRDIQMYRAGSCYAESVGIRFQHCILADRRVWLAQVLGADGLLYQSIDDLLAVAQSLNPTIKQFEASVFTGKPSLSHPHLPLPLPPSPNCAARSVLSCS